MHNTSKNTRGRLISSRRSHWILFILKVIGIITISDILFLPIFIVRRVPMTYALYQCLPFNTTFLLALGGFVLLTSFFSTKEVEELEYRGWKVGYFRKLHVLRKMTEEKLRARNEGIVMIVIGLLLYLTFHSLIQTVPPQFRI